MARNPGRVEAFSDGVLAIVITLLILEIKVPHLQDPLSRREAWDALRLLLPEFGSFILSFAAVIGAFVTPWVAWAVFVAVPVFFFWHSMHSPDAE